MHTHFVGRSASPACGQGPQAAASPVLLTEEDACARAVAIDVWKELAWAAATALALLLVADANAFAMLSAVAC